ncbi:MAG TPA: histidine phosphatase family protein [Acidimicrobiales bacterium]|nr:histidine phosphatase family protein [Acidimicrobiales bacterium]
MPGRLVVIRHAQSEWNAAGLWQGHADPVLSDEGRREARAAGKRLAELDSFDGVFCSDLSRAVETAEILTASMGSIPPPVVEPGLREYDVGEWSGRTRDEIEIRWPGDIARFSCGELPAPPGGETRSAFDDRVSEAAARIGRAAESAGFGAILVVAHGGVVRALARLASAAEYRVGHLAGYRGRHNAGGLLPEEPIDLLELELASDPS